MTTEVLPNGVNATAVVAYATRLNEDAPVDGTSFQAEVHWQGGFRNEILVRDLPPTYADEPEVLGGTNTAANPVEQIWARSGPASRSATRPARRPAGSRSKTSGST